MSRATFRLHWDHCTALWESNSISISWDLNFSQLREIWIVRWIASTSALLISIGGIGQENTHRNSPLQFLNTPPMVERIGLKEAFTFNLSVERGKADQSKAFFRGEQWLRKSGSIWDKLDSSQLPRVRTGRRDLRLSSTSLLSKESYLGFQTSCLDLHWKFGHYVLSKKTTQSQKSLIATPFWKKLFDKGKTTWQKLLQEKDIPKITPIICTIRPRLALKSNNGETSEKMIQGPICTIYIHFQMHV